jgi:Mlc titration factor MtfA (ptsG expression regulator)
MIGWLRNWRRQRALAQVQVGPAQWAGVESRLTFLGHLDHDERQRLRALAREFIATKEWNAAQGLTLTPTIQLTIALQACLPILHLGLDHYRGWLGIVVYPGDFVIPRSVIDEDGVVHEYDDPVLGEAWEGGPVLISWFDHPEDADGVNVVIHEFAHKLDMTNGTVDGIPALPADLPRSDWIAAFEPAYTDFCRQVDSGADTLLDPYAAEHPSEFFAVMSEAFFETPKLLRDEYPAVYTLLRRFYRQHPATD